MVALPLGWLNMDRVVKIESDTSPSALPWGRSTQESLFCLDNTFTRMSVGTIAAFADIELPLVFWTSSRVCQTRRLTSKKCSFHEGTKRGRYPQQDLSEQREGSRFREQVFDSSVQIALHA